MERVAFLVDQTGERINCMLNPETVEVRRVAGVRPHTTPGGQLVGGGRVDDPLLFTGGGRTELVLDLLFDTDLSDGGGPEPDVRDITRRLWSLAENSAQAQGAARPPLVRLVWGKTWNVPAVVVAVAERFDGFSAAGLPRRSWLRLKLLRAGEVDPPAATAAAIDPAARPAVAGRPGAGGPAVTGGAVAATGDGRAEPGFSGVRFDLLATEAFGGPLQWRRLAEHNDIDNPLDVAAGTVLTVPGVGR